MLKSIEQQKQYNKIILVPYVTLLASIIYYIYNFSFDGAVTSFLPAVVVWGITAILGLALLYLNRVESFPLIMTGALYVIYNLFMILLLDKGSLVSIAINCVYCVLWLSLIIVFFVHSKESGVVKEYSWLSFIALFFSAIIFIGQVNTTQTESSIKTLNPIFYILYFTPFVLLEKNKVLKYLQIVIIFACIILSYKRTALIAFLIILLYVAYRIGKDEEKSTKESLKNVLLFVLIIAVLLFIYNFILSRYSNINWLERLGALSEDGGSGRTDRWNEFFDDMQNSSFIQVVFGHGVVYPYYHNDLMQVIYNNGLIGCVLYVALCVYLIVLLFRMSKSNYKYTTAYGASLIIFFFNSAVGQVIVLHTWFLQMAVFWGIVLGDYYSFTKKKGKMLNEKN